MGNVRIKWIYYKKHYEKMCLIKIVRNQLNFYAQDQLHKKLVKAFRSGTKSRRLFVSA
jgi:hypothetical protein